MEQTYLICKKGFLALPCSSGGRMTLDFLGLGVFVLLSFILMHFYQKYLPERKIKQITPEKIHLKFWANVSMWGVIAMIVWLAAPWFGFLTVGYVPKVFTSVPWEYFGVGNLILLLNGFWKAEACAWMYTPKKVKGQIDYKVKRVHDTWTPRDTLWTTVFMYLCALALSYASSDILGGKF